MEKQYSEEERRTHSPKSEGLVVPNWLAAVLAVALVGSGSWLVKQNVTNSQSLAVMAVQIHYIVEQVESFKLTTDKRYRSSDAARDLAVINAKLVDCRERDKAFEKRLRELERRQ